MSTKENNRMGCTTSATIKGARLMLFLIAVSICIITYQSFAPRGFQPPACEDILNEAGIDYEWCQWLVKTDKITKEVTVTLITDKSEIASSTIFWNDVSGIPEFEDSLYK